MSDASKRRGGAIAVLSVVAVLATGCGSSSGSSSSSSSSGGSSSADASALGKSNPATGSPVKVGLLNVEGGSRVSQPEIGDAAQAAANYANDYLGGLGGHKIEIVRCGDKSDGASGAACANQFIQAGVAAVVSGQTATGDTIVPPLKGAGIPWLTTTGTSPSELGDDNAFMFASGFVGNLAAQAVYSGKQGWKTVTMLGTENPQLVSAVNSLGKKFFQAKGVTLNLVTVPNGTADAAPQVAAALQTKPDALAIIADPASCQAILSAATNAGAKQPKMSIASCLTKEVIKNVGDSGVDGTILFDNNVTTGSDHEAQLYQAVMQKYAAGKPTDGLTPNGYRAMLGFVRAANAGGIANGDVTPAAVSKAVRGAVNQPLPTGAGQTFSCDKTQFPFPAFKNITCSDVLFVSKYSGTKPGTPEVVHAADAVAG